MRKITKISIITTLALIMLLSVVLFSACNYERGDIRNFYGKYKQDDSPIFSAVITCKLDEEILSSQNIALTSITDTHYVYWTGAENKNIEHNYPCELVVILQEGLAILDCKIKIDKDNIILTTSKGELKNKSSHIKYKNTTYNIFATDTYQLSAYWEYMDDTERSGKWMRLSYQGEYIDNDGKEYSFSISRVYHKTLF